MILEAAQFYESVNFDKLTLQIFETRSCHFSVGVGDKHLLITYARFSARTIFKMLEIYFSSNRFD